MTDGLIGAVWLAVNLLIGRAAWIGVGRCFPGDSPIHRVQHVIVVLWAVIVLTCVGLGTAGAISPVLLGTCGLAVGCLVAAWLARRTRDPAAAPDASPRGDRSWDRTLSIGIGYGLAALVGASLIARGVCRFPWDWDSLMYHVPFIDHWLQAGSLYTPSTAVWYFPGNSELIGMWLVAPFSGDFWVGLASVPAALLLVLAAVELGRLMGLTPALLLGLVASLVSTEVFVKQIATSENDLAVAALFMSGVAYGVRWVSSGGDGDLALLSASLGLLAGVKYYALGYAAVAWAGLLLFSLRRRGWRATARLAIAGAAATAALAGYWYARNFVATGSPLYPLGFTEETDDLAGLRTGRVSSSLLGNRGMGPILQWVDSVWELGGPCHYAAVLALPVVLPWLLESLSSRAKRSGDGDASDPRWLLALLLAGSLMVFGITPNVIDPTSEGQDIYRYLSVRFSQCPLTLAVLAVAAASADAARRLRRSPEARSPAHRALPWAPAAAFVGLATAQFAMRVGEFLGPEPWIVVVAAIHLVAFGAAARWLSASPGGRAVLLAALLLTAAASSHLLAGWWHRGFSRHYNNFFRTDIFTRLEQSRAAPPTIAVIDYRYYPFLGSRRQFRVHRPTKVLSESSLLSYLAESRADIASIESRDRPHSAGRYRGVGQWARNHPEALKLIGRGDNFEVYEIRRNALARSLRGG